VGEQRLTALQAALQSQCWPDTSLLLTQPAAAGTAPVLRQFSSLDAELAGCAAWCRERLDRDGAARLLIVSACGEPSLAIQGELLWRQLAGSARDLQELRNRLLAVEGGAPLHHLGLIADALMALECLAAELDTGVLYALLRSPYFRFGSELQLWSLQGRFEKWGLARWPIGALREALASVAEQEPAAARLLAWLAALHEKAGAGRRSAIGWAGSFSDALAGAGFNQQQGLDSREQQRFDRWGELLDEFAALDAVLPPLDAASALRRLRQLAAEGRHQVASGDAAITLSSTLADPVVDYDGIWVLGLAESRWPAPPRPDAYVALHEQREHHWPESGVSERRAQAQWALERWQRRTGELVLSYPEREGDLHHRPTALPGVPAVDWQEHATPIVATALGFATPTTDQQFPALAAQALDRPLAGGERRLSTQRDCPFRAQAQWRLKAHAPDPLSDGLTTPMRGTLLHLLLQGLWEELGDQARLRALTPQAERALLEKHWHRIIDNGSLASARWWPAGLRERERQRTLDIVAEVLQLERARPPFAVRASELKLQWPESGARLSLRIDRVDRAADGARILIDYKSGAPGRMKLHEGELEPLQLALYVAALAAHGEPVDAAALFSLKPDELGLAGVGSAQGAALPGLRPIGEWEAQASQWQQQLLQLITEHLAGDGTLARAHEACRHCHLPALCRRAALEDLEEADE
jgi:probable DNA repair protein